jgi:hypothetical protein
LRVRVRSAEQAIAEAAAHSKAGDDQKAEAIITRALPDVRAIPHPRTEAELLLLQADCTLDRGDPRAALESSEAAVEAAERAADDALAARAAARVAYLLSSWLSKPQEGERWMKAAEAIADRAGRNDALDAALLGSRIPVNAMLGHPELNQDLHDRRWSCSNASTPSATLAWRGRWPIEDSTTICWESSIERWRVFRAALPFDDRRGAGQSAPGPQLHEPRRDPRSRWVVCRTPKKREHARALEADAPAGALTVTILGALAGITARARDA